MAFGVVVRFDEDKGYGFIAPDDGGNDVFVHANELTDRGRSVSCGTRVQFNAVDSGRGLKAYGVRVMGDEKPLDEVREDLDDDTCEVVSLGEFNRLATELLLRKAPDLTGKHILEIRAAFAEFACERGWVDAG